MAAFCAPDAHRLQEAARRSLAVIRELQTMYLLKTQGTLDAYSQFLAGNGGLLDTVASTLELDATERARLEWVVRHQWAVADAQKLRIDIANPDWLSASWQNLPNLLAATPLFLEDAQEIAAILDRAVGALVDPQWPKALGGMEEIQWVRDQFPVIASLLAKIAASPWVGPYLDRTAPGVVLSQRERLLQLGTDAKSMLERLEPALTDERSLNAVLAAIADGTLGLRYPKLRQPAIVSCLGALLDGWLRQLESAWDRAGNAEGVRGRFPFDWGTQGTLGQESLQLELQELAKYGGPVATTLAALTNGKLVDPAILSADRDSGLGYAVARARQWQTFLAILDAGAHDRPIPCKVQVVGGFTLWAGDKEPSTNEGSVDWLPAAGFSVKYEGSTHRYGGPLGLARLLAASRQRDDWHIVTLSGGQLRVQLGGGFVWSPPSTVTVKRPK